MIRKIPKHELDLPTTAEDFQVAIKKVSKSVSSDDIDQFMKWMEEFGSVWSEGESHILFNIRFILFIFIKLLQNCNRDRFFKKLSDNSFGEYLYSDLLIIFLAFAY